MKINPGDQTKPPFKIYLCRTTYFVENRDGTFAEMSERMLRRRLIQRDYFTTYRDKNNKLRKDLSQIEELLERVSQEGQIDMHLDRLAGHDAGFQVNNGIRLLVTNKAPAVPARQGKWDTIAKLWTEQMGETQLPYLLTWLQAARKRVLSHQFAPLQGMALTGDPNAGKTTDVQLISGCLGRSANPFQYIIEKSTFNENVAAAELLVMDDEHSVSLKKGGLENIADYLKWVAVKPDHHVHPKGRKAYVVDLITVPVICCNFNPKDIRIIPPPFDGDMRRRLHILKIEVPAMFAGKTPGQKEALRETLFGEVAALNWHLDHEYVSPPGIADPLGRFPCKAWQHSEAVSMICGLSRPMQFRQLVLTVIESDEGDYSSAEILGMLGSSDLSQVSLRLASDVQTVGDLLSAWKKLRPREIPDARRSHGITRWQIVRPAGFEGMSGFDRVQTP